jgi:hypothetical protein
MAGPPLVDPDAIRAAMAEQPGPRPGRRPSLGWLLGVGLLAVSLVYAWFRGGESAANLDHRLVLVLPFETTGADPALQQWRERIPALFAAELTPDGPVRTTDPDISLVAWRLRGGSHEADLPMASALTLAEEMGAGRLLMGRLAGETQLVLMTTTLYNVPGGHVIGEAYVEGPLDSLPFLVARLATRLRFRW